MKILDKQSFLNKTLGVLDNQNVNINQLIVKAHQLGIYVKVYTEHESRAFQYADNVIIGSLKDKAQLQNFAKQCNWVIYVNSIGVDDPLINELKQVTNVPQGTDALDLLNDQSIFHVFLDSLQLPSLPYLTVFNVSDVKRAMKEMNFPVVLRPVQTDVHGSQAVLITKDDDLDRLSSLFTGGAYLLEALPENARYFNLTLFKASSGANVVLPVVENHYQGSKFDFANLNSKIPLEFVDKFKMMAQKITNALHYVGGLTLSFILTKNHQIYVNGINLPFNLVNNVFNRAPDDVDKLFLRMLIGADVKLTPLKSTWLIKPITRVNVKQAQKLLIKSDLFNVNLDSIANSNNQAGYALISADSFEDAKKKLQESQL